MMSLFGFFRRMFPAATPQPAEPAPKPARKPRAKKATVKKSLPVAKKKRSAK
jgi:hypothetical protein